MSFLSKLLASLTGKPTHSPGQPPTIKVVPHQPDLSHRQYTAKVNDGFPLPPTAKPRATPFRVPDAVKSFARQAFKPVIRKAELVAPPPVAGSRFGGWPALNAGESWPTCGKCRREMPIFLQLNSHELPAAANTPFGDGLLQFFFCTECDDWEPLGNAYLARVLGVTGGLHLGSPRDGKTLFPQRIIEGWTAHDDFPNNEELEELGVDLSEEEFEALYEDEDVNIPVPGDKLLGWPNWVQGVEYVECPKCKERMRHVFHLESEEHVPYMFGDCGAGQIQICPNHPDVLAFTWACT